MSLNLSPYILKMSIATAMRKEPENITTFLAQIQISRPNFYYTWNLKKRICRGNRPSLRLVLMKVMNRIWQNPEDNESKSTGFAYLFSGTLWLGRVQAGMQRPLAVAP